MTPSGAGFVAAIQPPAASATPLDPRRDSLGVRADFPVLLHRIYLSFAYIAPVHRAVVAARQAHLEAKSKSSLDMGSPMRTNNAVRAQFARTINAAPEEIGLLFSTGGGQNTIASGAGLKPGDNVVIDDLHDTTEFVLSCALEASTRW
jgi:hypothetical protein